MQSGSDAPRSGDCLRLELLGSPRLIREGHPVHVLEGRDAVLLALLAVEGPTSRGRAAALLWPDSDPSRASNSLRQRLFRLKRSMGRDVITCDRFLALAPEVRHDLDDFAEGLRRDGGAGGGELLGTVGFADGDDLGDWLNAARERWRATRRELVAQEASRLEGEGRIASALELAERLVLDDPEAEHAHRRLMRLHYLRGDRAAALGVFERCKRALMQAVQARPGAETLQLAAIIERSGVLPEVAPARTSSPRPVTVLRPPLLVGRGREWQAIQAAWTRARIVVVSGEPGIGKSRLLGDLATACEGSCHAGARPGDASVPYAMAVRLMRALFQRYGNPPAGWVPEELARILPELGCVPASELQSVRLHDAVSAALRHCASRGFHALLVDDLQFADEASLEWLFHWMQTLDEAAPRLAIAVRRNEWPLALAKWMQAQVEQRPVEVELHPLSAADLALLVDSLAIEGLSAADWAVPLARHTGGNPMFVLETLIALLPESGVPISLPLAELPVPASIGALIERRLTQLSPAAHRLAQLAALAGANFSVPLAAGVLGVHALDLSAAWLELEAAQMLRGGALAHDLISEAIVHSVPAPIARQLHMEIAVTAQQLGASPAYVAQHWFEAGHWASAAQAFMRAADTARAASQRRLEGELAARAAACFDRCGDVSGRFIAREREHSTTRYTLRLDLQLDSAKRLLALASTPAERGIALEACAAVLVEDFRHAEVAAAAQEAREIAASLGDSTRELTAARTQSRALGWMKRGDEALGLLRQYLPRAQASLHEEAGVRALAEFGCTLMTCDRFDEAAALFDRALQAALALEDWGLCQECHRHMAWVHDYRGEIEKSIHSYEASEALATRLGAHRVPASISRSIFARRYKELGRFGEALALLETVRDEQQDSEGVAVSAVTDADLSGLFLWLGQPARAMSVLRTPALDAPPAMHRTYHFAAAQVETWQGRAGLAALRKAMAWADQESGPFHRFVIECELARSLPADEGASLALDAMARSDAIGLELSTWPLKAIASDALRRGGRIGEALVLARQCTSHFSARVPFVLYPPEYWWIAHQVFVAAHDRAAADDALRHARDWIRMAVAHVPEPFRDSFVHRNPVNRSVLAATAQWPAR